MDIEYTPDGIPVISLATEDMQGPPPAGLFAALDQVVANANERLFPSRLPTTPGLYVPRGVDDDLNDITVWRLDPEGFWWRHSRTGVTAEEVAAANGGVALEALVRESEKDL